MRNWILSTMAATYIPEILPGIRSRIWASRFESMASGVSSSLSLEWWNLTISSLLGPKDILITRPARGVSISGQIWGLPVMKIQASGDLSRISFQKLKSRNRWTAVHSSRPSMTINVRWEYVISWSIFTISPSWSASTSSLSLLLQGSPYILRNSSRSTNHLLEQGT